MLFLKAIKVKAYQCFLKTKISEIFQEVKCIYNQY